MMEENNEQARNWAMWCHLSSIAGITVVFPFPFLNILCPLIVWHFKKNQLSFIEAHGKESLNFQLSLLIYTMIFAVILLFLIGFIIWTADSDQSFYSIATIGIMLLYGLIGLYGIAGILSFALVIFAAVKAKKGEFYHYPFTIRFLE